MTTYEICSVPDYKKFVYAFNPEKIYLNVAKKYIQNIENISAVVNNDLQLHERFKKDDLLKLLVDVDKLTLHNKNATLESVLSHLCEYVGVEMDDIRYTTNFSCETGSHHIVIPKYYMKSSNQKIYWKQFREKYGYGNEIDTDGIFDKECWFRLPNQTKEKVKETEHIIQKGKISDFVLKYIDNSVEMNLPNMFIETKKVTNKVTKKVVVQDESETDTESVSVNTPLIETDIYYKYLNCIGSTMCGKGDHLNTINVLQALRNENCDDKYVKYWIESFCDSKLKKYTYAIDYYKNHNYIKYTPLHVEKRLSIKSLKKWAKKNKELYGTYFKDDYDFQIRKMYNFKSLITNYQDERSYMLLIYTLLEKRIILDGETIYLYYNDEWRTMKEKDCKILKNVIIEIFDIYIKVGLDIVNDYIKDNLNNDEKLTEGKKMQKVIYELNCAIKKVTYVNNICSLLKNKLATIKNTIVFDLGTDNLYNIQFKNGVYDLKTGFRTRVETDYVTQTLDYNYIEEKEINKDIQNVVMSYFEKSQPNEEQRRFTLSYLAYCLTGNTTKQVFKMNIGKTASNGKSTEIKIFKKCFDLYACKCDSRVLENGFEKRHKFLNDLVNKPIRLLYFEELPKGKKLDVKFIKDFVDGDELPLEIMFGTKCEINIQAKIMTVSNHDFNVDTDEGILRRGRVQYYKSKFVDDVEIDDKENHIYKKVEGFENKFNDEYYKNAYFHLLLKYVDDLYIPKKNKDDFKDKAEENDEILNNILEYYEITNNLDDKINKLDFMEKLNVTDKNFKDYKEKLESKACEYNSQEKYTYTPNGVEKGVRKTGVFHKLKVKIETA